ncbi:hypothetical protein ACFY05_32195 [Microtetraspora fusca]|uniref:Uncharacterized protein n=1 Tax=Microtetraspora fusca TaxID=1997 RepID=A0ABW6VDU5_MICFU
MRIQLPYVNCVDCAGQIIPPLFAIQGRDALICLFCGVARSRDGQGHTIVPLKAADESPSYGFAPAMDQFDAAALVCRLGGTVLEDQ